MNYIDPNATAPQVLAINVNLPSELVATTTINWSLLKEGNDSEAITFESPSTNFNLSDMGYYNAFSVDFDAEGIDLASEHGYVLTGVANGVRVYCGKVYVTEQDILTYSSNDGQYTLKESKNNFVILD